MTYASTFLGSSLTALVRYLSAVSESLAMSASRPRWYGLSSRPAARERKRERAMYQRKAAAATETAAMMRFFMPDPPR